MRRGVLEVESARREEVCDCGSTSTIDTYEIITLLVRCLSRVNAAACPRGATPPGERLGYPYFVEGIRKP